MRKITLAVMLSMMASLSFAQLVNDGATITIKNGATLFVESDVTNNGAGTIAVEGTGILEVQGHLTNNATLTTQSGSKVKFSGAANSNFKSNGASISNLEISKTGSTVTLTDAASVSGNLDFGSAGSSKLLLGNNNLVLGSAATATGHDADEYVAINGTGVVQKNYADNTYTNNLFTYPIGDASFYSPLTTSISGTAVSANVKVKVTNAIQPNKAATLPEATSYLTRYWNVDQTGFTSYSNILTGQYNTSDDVVGTQSKIKGASFFSPNWSFAAASNNVSTPSVTGTVTLDPVDFTGTDALNTVDITAMMNGAIVGAGTSMSNDLQNYFGGNTGLLPTTSPYGLPTSTYAAINNPAGAAGQVVDWVKVEVRSASNPSTILETRSLLVKPNGSIVDPNGKIPYFKESTTPVQLTVQHRNHLGIMSNSIPSFSAANVTYNFTTALSQAFNVGGDPAQLILRNGKWAMIQGDVNMDLSVDGVDITLIKVSANAGTFDEYLASDINMDGSVDGVDVTLAKIAAAAGYYSTLINF